MLLSQLGSFCPSALPILPTGVALVALQAMKCCKCHLSKILGPSTASSFNLARAPGRSPTPAHFTAIHQPCKACFTTVLYALVLIWHALLCNTTAWAGRLDLRSWKHHLLLRRCGKYRSVLSTPHWLTDIIDNCMGPIPASQSVMSYVISSTAHCSTWMSWCYLKLFPLIKPAYSSSVTLGTHLLATVSFTLPNDGMQATYASPLLEGLEAAPQGAAMYVSMTG